MTATRKPKPIQLPPRKNRNVTAAKAVNQKAGPFKRKPKETLYPSGYGSRVFVWRDDELPGGW